MNLLRLICKLRGGCTWVEHDLVYKTIPATEWRILNDDEQVVHRGRSLAVTWVNDERCRFCKRESWWPT